MDDATLLVAAGAAVGAPLRYLVGLLAARRPGFPWGTLGVNLAGSTLLGLIVGRGVTADSHVYLLVGTGFCGALTTWSTLGAETVALWTGGRRGTAALYVGATVVLGVGLAATAHALASAS